MAYSKLNPRTTHYEFFGPPGALAITLGTPLVSYAVYFFCSPLNDSSSTSHFLANVQPQTPPSFLKDGGQLLDMLGSKDWWSSVWEWDACAVYGMWYLYTVLCWMILPGKWVEGTLIRDGKKQWYKMNGNAWTPLPPDAT
jgi:delta14-sterol reductase